jgi:drug/metabolite transporter (DMT)-like permease
MGSISKSLSLVLLMIAAIIWGFAFVAQRSGMMHTSPFVFNGIRFLLGALFLIPVLMVRRSKESVKDDVNRKHFWLGGILTGMVLFIAASLQQIGMVYTTAGNGGFITSLYVIIVPFIGLLWNRNINIQTWVGVVLATAGLYFLSGINIASPKSGDLLVLISAFFFALHVQIIGQLAPKFNPVKFSAVQFAVCSLFSLIGAVLTEDLNPKGITNAAIPILYSGIMSVGVAYTLQTISQQRANPTHAAMILSTESVFALLGGWLILSEDITPKGLLGCMLMFAGIVLSQLKKFQKA